MKFLSHTQTRALVIAAISPFLASITPAVAAPLTPSFFAAKTPPAGAIWLETLELENITQDYWEAEAAQSVKENPLTVQKIVYPHGVGSHSHARALFDLKEQATRFVCLLGIDDETRGQGSVALRITLDGVVKFESPTVRGNGAPVVVDVDLRGARQMLLEVLEVDNVGNDNADLLGAALYLTPAALKEHALQPVILPRPARPKSLLPLWREAPAKPEINGPRLVGVSPGKPFLFLVPATGKAPLQFEASGLPPGLKLDAQSGIISGRVEKSGTFKTTIRVKNGAGTDSKPLAIEVGKGKMMLTPLLGWNASTVFGELVTAKLVAEQVDYLFSSGLAARGWNTVIVDDTWQSRRDADGTIGSNRRFGSIKSLADYVHSKGLKFGLLSSPTPRTPSGFAGSEGFEDRDAQLYASWGVDVLKFDWGAESGQKTDSREQVVAAYKRMRAALDKTDRDIALHVVNYGFGASGAEIGSEAGGQLWRTSDFLLDSWASLERATFDQPLNFRFARSGGWNDFGQLKIGRFTPRNAHFSLLTPDEQKLQMTAWTLGQSAMILSCDLTQLDPNGFYRLASPLLMNPEVLAIHQDVGGNAERVRDGDVNVWKRQLSDGRIAVAFLNRRNEPRTGEIVWAELGLSGKKKVRDVWNRKDAGQLDAKISADVAGHGAALFVVGP